MEMSETVHTYIWRHTKNFCESFLVRTNRLNERTKKGVRLIPVLVRKPAIAALWLKSARAAQISALTVLLLVPAVLAGATDALIEKLYPPVTEKQLFGILKQTRENPRLESNKHLARIALWTSAGGVILFLLVLHIPLALKRAESRSREFEQEADTLLKEKPLESIRLYRAALSLATDSEYEASVAGKISFLNERLTKSIAPGSALKEQAPDDERTVVLPSRGVRNQGASEPRSGRTPSTVGSEGRYQLRAPIGRGAMGVVHRAYDSVLEREVALKELMTDLTRDSESVSRFRHEAKVLAQLTHPGIIQVHDFIEESGRIWIVMELIKGGDLTDLLKEQGWLPASIASRLGVQMAEAMGYSHARGVVHRDFKPSNVLLTPGGSVKISDFGLAKLVRSVQHTQAGVVMGTPAYMSPEQAKGKIADNRSDIYSMGIVLYQMLTGRLPFEGDDFAGTLAQHINEEPVPLRYVVADIPEELEALVLKMLYKDPASRVQDMRTVGSALKVYASH